MTKADYDAGKTPISADYKADKAACTPLPAKYNCTRRANAGIGSTADRRAQS